MTLRHPLSKARGLGSAKDGTGHWIAQRVTAIIMAPLLVWFLYALVDLTAGGAGAEEVRLWMQSPLQALAMVIFLGAMFYHSALGLQVVVEDYIHCECLKIAALLIVKIGMLVAGAGAILAVIKMHLGV